MEGGEEWWKGAVLSEEENQGGECGGNGDGAEALRLEVSPPNCAPPRVSTTVVETLPRATYVSVNSAVRVSGIGGLRAMVAGSLGGGGPKWWGRRDIVSGAEARRVEVSPPNCAPPRVSTTVVETLPCATLVSDS